MENNGDSWRHKPTDKQNKFDAIMQTAVDLNKQHYNERKGITIMITAVDKTDIYVLREGKGYKILGESEKKEHHKQDWKVVRKI